MLIILLVVMLVGIVAALLFGTVRVPVKSAYFTPDAELVHIDGKTVVRIEHRGGDVLGFNGTRGPGTVYPVALFIQSPPSMTEVRTAPSVRSPAYHPGDTIYIYHAGSGYLLSDNGSSVHPDRDIFPVTAGTPAYILIVDRTENVTVARIGPF